MSTALPIAGEVGLSARALFPADDGQNAAGSLGRSNARSDAPPGEITSAPWVIRAGPHARGRQSTKEAHPRSRRQMGDEALSFKEAPAGGSDEYIAMVDPAPVMKLADEEEKSLGDQTAQLQRFFSKKRLNTSEELTGITVLIENVVAHIIREPDGLEHIARQLARSAGVYGGHLQETLTREAQFALVHSWLDTRVFPGGIGAFASQILLAAKAEYACHPRRPLRLPFSALQTRLNDWLAGGNLTVYSGPGQLEGALSQTAAHYILEEVVKTALPVLSLPERELAESHVFVGGLDAGLLHAGLLFTRQAAPGLAKLTVRELIELGGSIEDILREGLADPALIRLFELPACLYYGLSPKPDKSILAGTEQTETDQDHARRALEAFFAALDARRDEENPYRQLSEALQNYRSRIQFIQQLSANTGNGDPDAAPDNADERYCLGDEEPLPVDDPDALFARQNDMIAARYAVVDMLMLAAAFESLPSDEADFLRRAEVRRGDAEFSAAHTVRRQMAAHVISPYALTVRLASGVELLVGRLGGETRIYALRYHDSAYALTRMDQEAQRYYPLMADGGKCAHDPDYQLKIFIRSDVFPLLKSPDDSLEHLAEQLIRQHRMTFATHLHHQGYERTSLEKVKDFMLSLVPLYDCLTGLEAKKSEAALSCALDVISFLPLIGAGMGLGLRFMQHGVKGGMLAYQAALRSLATRQTLRQAVGESGRRLFRYAVLPAAEELNRATLIQFGIAGLRSMDPGVEWIGSLGYHTLEQVLTAARTVTRQVPVWKKILPFAGDVAQQRPMAANHYPIEYGRLAGWGKPLPMIPLGGDTFRGRTVYVRIDIDTGTLFGKKYTLASDGELHAIPLPLAQRLKNILEQGLSGRGAPRASRRLARPVAGQELATSSTGPSDLTVDMLLRWLEIRRMGGADIRDDFLRRFNLDAEYWSHYIAPSGELTERAGQLLSFAGFHDWNRLLGLPPELQIMIIRYLDIRALQNLLLAFPLLDVAPPQAASLRYLVERRKQNLLDIIARDNTAWMMSSSFGERRWLALNIITAYYSTYHRQLILAGLRLKTLPPQLPSDLLGMDVSANQLSALLEQLPGNLEQLNVSVNKLSVLPEALPSRLSRLDASINRLTRLPALMPSTLTHLKLNNNQLTALPDALPGALTHLDISGNTVVRIPEHLPAGLLELKANANVLTLLPERLPRGLRRLELQNNLLTHLPGHLPSTLQVLDLYHNLLNSLPERLPRRLKILEVSSNRLEHLPASLPQDLRELLLTNNLMSRLPPALPGKLKILRVAFNNLAALPDVLPASIVELDVANNMLVSLPASLPADLKSLRAGYNVLTHLPDNLPAGLQTLSVAHTQLTCLPSPLPVTLRVLDIRSTYIQSRPDNLPTDVQIVSSPPTEAHNR
ncbi:hypothetical protein [Martelella alba]|uniref:Leucine-rich repeat (LRR) protein n=1 Tax=Martelella alba TaxID=2590451 RepID=A0ABY2SIB6_9HYPH|nr:hypothetical protein [Martelella alba]TKI05121.1 hypothetical protein FCN80_15585 [Martelella alba]